MCDICTDNRLELIEKYKKELIESTNIESSQDEMNVLDDLLFRFWQMRWLDRLEEPERKKGKWITMSDTDGVYWVCSECGEDIPRIAHFNPQFDLFPRLESIDKTYFCPNCGARMGREGEEDGE